mmetsp:Transcript_100913/g.260821  ORF Transcript_100913/g.260821 Transcript_100913/m.260821 type:complete len:231 (+) Transcript_100913:170-862(+)
MSGGGRPPSGGSSNPPCGVNAHTAMTAPISTISTVSIKAKRKQPPAPSARAATSRRQAPRLDSATGGISCARRVRQCLSAVCRLEESPVSARPAAAGALLGIGGVALTPTAGPACGIALAAPCRGKAFRPRICRALSAQDDAPARQRSSAASALQRLADGSATAWTSRVSSALPAASPRTMSSAAATCLISHPKGSKACGARFRRPRHPRGPAPGLEGLSSLGTEGGPEE